MTTVVAQQAINGIVVGSLYVLVALGLTLIYGVLVQINFAHADFVTLGAFAAYFFMHLLGGSYLAASRSRWWSARCSAGSINAGDLRAAARASGSELLPLIATIGVSTMMQNAMLAWFGPIPYAFETPYSQQVCASRASFFTVQSLIIIAVSTATIGLLYAFMKFTFLGKALRAVSQDRETAGPDGDQPEPPDHAHHRDRLGARRHGRRDARRRCWCSPRSPAPR